MKKNRFLITVVSILMGLIFGSIILLVAGFNPVEAYKIMWDGIFGNARYMSWVIIRSTPIILTGISVAFAFKTGLFNIGVEGQFIIGAIFAALAGYFINLPPILHAIVALLIGALAAGLWGGIIGILKAKYGINEVITSIMLNWIALYLNNYVLTFQSFRRPNSDASYRIQESARTMIFADWKVSDSGRAFLAEREALRNFMSPPVNMGFIIALMVAFGIWYVLKNTTLGYQLKAVGNNKYAAEYGGIDVNKKMIISLMIAGAIGGLAGATQVLGVDQQIGILATSPGYGFDGIAVALIALNNPIATVPAGLLFGGLKYSGSRLNATIGAPSEIINITIGIIVLFVAMPKLIELVTGLFKKRGDKVD